MLRWTFYQDEQGLWRWRRETFGMFVLRSDRGYEYHKDCRIDARGNGWSGKWYCYYCGIDIPTTADVCANCVEDAKGVS